MAYTYYSDEGVLFRSSVEDPLLLPDFDVWEPRQRVWRHAVSQDDVVHVVALATIVRASDVRRLWPEALARPQTDVVSLAWSEGDHPRDDAGRFTSGAGDAGSAVSSVTRSDDGEFVPRDESARARLSEAKASIESIKNEMAAVDERLNSLDAAIASARAKFKADHPDADDIAAYMKENLPRSAQEAIEARANAIETSRRLQDDLSSKERSYIAEKDALFTQEVSERTLEAMNVPGVTVSVSRDRRDFVVGDQTFSEAGHYNPSTKSIVMRSDFVALLGNDAEAEQAVQHVMSHEVTHHVWQSVQDAVAAERPRLKAEFNTDNATLWGKSGYLRPEHAQAVRERYPASAFMQRHTGDFYLDTGTEAASEKVSKLASEDGVTGYSKSYWDVYAQNRDSRWFERSTNETLAEMTAIRYGKTGGVLPKSSSAAWKDMHEDLFKTYRAHVAPKAK